MYSLIIMIFIIFFCMISLKKLINGKSLKNYNVNLKGKTAIITGGNSGIGA